MVQPDEIDICHNTFLATIVDKYVHPICCIFMHISSKNIFKTLCITTNTLYKYDLMQVVCYD